MSPISNPKSVRIIKKKTESPSNQLSKPDNIEETELFEADAPMTVTKAKISDSDPVLSQNNDDPFDFDPSTVDTSKLIPLFDKTSKVVQSNPLDEIRSDLRLESLNVHDNHEYWGEGNELYSLHHETSGDYLDFILGYE